MSVPTLNLTPIFQNSKILLTDFRNSEGKLRAQDMSKIKEILENYIQIQIVGDNGLINRI